MPVISLPEYLGISEAPQQPVFQRTRQVEPDSPWARTMQVADSLTALRNQRPMAQIQAIQNEYDMIRENAEKLRREREAAMQAEQAVSSLAGLTPDSPDYLNQRRQIMTQFPSAILDPRVQSIMDDSDRMYNARQQAEARRQEEITTRAADLVRKGGIDIAKAQEAAKSPLTAAQLEYQFGRPTSSNIGRLEKALGTVQDLIKSVPEEERYDFVDGKQIVRPEFKTLLDRQKKYANMYFNEVEGISPQQEAQAATPTAPAATPTVAPAATVTPPAPTPKVDLERELSHIPVTEQATWLENRKKQEGELQRINESWTKAKQSLESRLKEKYPDKPYPGLKTSPLDQLALQIYNGVAVTDTSVPTAGDTALKLPIADKVLLDLGEDIFSGKPAFTEPGSKRKSLLGLVGTQNVTYGELIRDWADKYVKQRNLVQVPLTERMDAPKEELEKGQNILNKYVPASNG